MTKNEGRMTTATATALVIIILLQGLVGIAVDANPPSPEITAVGFPGASTTNGISYIMYLGETQTIKVSVVNSGGDADNGTVCMMFPNCQNPRQVNLTDILPPNVLRANKGDIIEGGYEQRLTFQAHYMEVCGEWNKWPTGVSHSMSISFKPDRIGTQMIFLKVLMMSSGKMWSDPGASQTGQHIHVDHASENVYAYSLQVKRPMPRVVSGPVIDKNPAYLGETVSISMTATNDGDTAESGSLHIGIQGSVDASMVQISSTDLKEARILPVGSSTTVEYGSTIGTTTGIVVNADVDDWGKGSQHDLTINFTPVTSGTYTFFAKALSHRDGGNWFGSPPTEGTQGMIDCEREYSWPSLLDVRSPTYSVSLVASENSLQLLPGGQTQVEVLVSNTGDNRRETIVLEVQSPTGWTAVLDHNQLVIGRAGTGQAILSVRAPAVLSRSDSVAVRVSCHIVDDPTRTNESTIQIKAAGNEGIDVTGPVGTIAIPPGNTRETLLMVSNTGYFTSTYSLTTQLTDGWKASLPVSSLTLGSGQATYILVSVTAPTIVSDGSSGSVRVEAKVTSNPSVFDSFSVNYVIRGSAEIELRVPVPPPALDSATRSERVDVVVRNVGNLVVSMTIRAYMDTSDWTSIPSKTSLDLMPSDQETVFVDIQVPTGLMDETLTRLHFVATPAGSAPIEVEVPIEFRDKDIDGPLTVSPLVSSGSYELGDAIHVYFAVRDIAGRLVPKAKVSYYPTPLSSSILETYSEGKLLGISRADLAPNQVKNGILAVNPTNVQVGGRSVAFYGFPATLEFHDALATTTFGIGIDEAGVLGDEFGIGSATEMALEGVGQDISNMEFTQRFEVGAGISGDLGARVGPVGAYCSAGVSYGAFLEGDLRLENLSERDFDVIFNYATSATVLIAVGISYPWLAPIILPRLAVIGGQLWQSTVPNLTNESYIGGGAYDEASAEVVAGFPISTSLFTVSPRIELVGVGISGSYRIEIFGKLYKDGKFGLVFSHSAECAGYFDMLGIGDHFSGSQNIDFELIWPSLLSVLNCMNGGDAYPEKAVVTIEIQGDPLELEREPQSGGFDWFAPLRISSMSEPGGYRITFEGNLSDPEFRKSGILEQLSRGILQTNLPLTFCRILTPIQAVTWSYTLEKIESMTWDFGVAVAIPGLGFSVDLNLFRTTSYVASEGIVYNGMVLAIKESGTPVPDVDIGRFILDHLDLSLMLEALTGTGVSGHCPITFDIRDETGCRVQSGVSGVTYPKVGIDGAIVTRGTEQTIRLPAGHDYTINISGTGPGVYAVELSSFKDDGQKTIALRNVPVTSRTNDMVTISRDLNVSIRTSESKYYDLVLERIDFEGSIESVLFPDMSAYGADTVTRIDVRDWSNLANPDVIDIVQGSGEEGSAIVPFSASSFTGSLWSGSLTGLPTQNTTITLPSPHQRILSIMPAEPISSDRILLEGEVVGTNATPIYQWRIDGQIVGNSNPIQVGPLPPGTHVIELCIRIGDGAWSESSVVIISVSAPDVPISNPPMAMPTITYLIITLACIFSVIGAIGWLWRTRKR